MEKSTEKDEKKSLKGFEKEAKKQLWIAEHVDIELQGFGKTPKEAIDVFKEKYREMRNQLRTQEFPFEALKDEITVKRVEAGKAYHPSETEPTLITAKEAYEIYNRINEGKLMPDEWVCPECESPKIDLLSDKMREAYDEKYKCEACGVYFTPLIQFKKEDEKNE